MTNTNSFSSISYPPIGVFYPRQKFSDSSGVFVFYNILLISGLKLSDFNIRRCVVRLTEHVNSQFSIERFLILRPKLTVGYQTAVACRLAGGRGSGANIFSASRCLKVVLSKMRLRKIAFRHCMSRWRLACQTTALVQAKLTRLLIRDKRSVLTTVTKSPRRNRDSLFTARTRNFTIIRPATHLGLRG